jgi:hypothetical protein
MTAENSQVVRGYVSNLSIRKVFDQGVARFDVELSLSSEWRDYSNKTVIRFTDARNVRYGDSREGIDFGAHVSLAIEDVSNHGWDGIRFKAYEIEGGGLSLYCRRFDVEEVSAVSLPEHCTVLF